jgi:hypothetical protein
VTRNILFCRIVGVMVVTLAMGAIVGPASARTFDFNSNGSLVQQSNSGGTAPAGTHKPPADPRPQHFAELPWPSAADYRTIKKAVAVRNNALFHQRGWRQKSFEASLAARTLLTVRIEAGPCAAYVTELYGNLRDLMDAHPGEDWRPLVRSVRRQPSLARACKDPTPEHGFG